MSASRFLMSFKSLSDLLTVIQQRPAWSTYHQYCLVQSHWQTVIAAKFFHKTRPVGISYDVLWVATESAAIAQHLSLQRYTLLKRLNGLLSEPLKDIHFSSAAWLNSPPPPPEISQQRDKITHLTEPKHNTPPKTPSEAFQRWADVLEKRSQQLPLCPLCQSPTELWELERWSMCGYCAIKEN